MIEKIDKVGKLKANSTGKLVYVLLEILTQYRYKQIPISELAKKLGVTRGTISKNLHRLEEKGYIKIYPFFDADGTRKANVYKVIRRENE